LISNQRAPVDQRLIDLHIRRWLELSAYVTCFHSTHFHSRHPTLDLSGMSVESLYATYADQDLYVTLEKNLDSISLYGLDPNDDRHESQFGFHGECFFCSLLRKGNTRRQNLNFEKRLGLIGGYAPSIFFLEVHEQDRSSPSNGLVLDDKFFTRFNGLELIDIENVTIDQFQLSAKNSDSLKHLMYLSLDNTGLTTMQADFRHLNRLAYLKLSHNPLESLPLNCFSSRSLQSVELVELGRLLEMDPNARFSSELKTFIMSESVITSLPQSLGFDARTKLTKFTLSGVSWWRPEGISVNEVVKYESFEKKFVPFLDNQDLSSIYQMYDEDTNGVLSFSEINLMNAHIYRFLPRLRSANVRIVSELPLHILILRTSVFFLS
jgi:Leucine-rich repeat (LRR) protein